jgi:hypothetical protein
MFRGRHNRVEQSIANDQVSPLMWINRCSDAPGGEKGRLLAFLPEADMTQAEVMRWPFRVASTGLAGTGQRKLFW